MELPNSNHYQNIGGVSKNQGLTSNSGGKNMRVHEGN